MRFTTPSWHSLQVAALHVSLTKQHNSHRLAVVARSSRAVLGIAAIFAALCATTSALAQRVLLQNRIGIVHPLADQPTPIVSPRRVFLSVPHLRQEKDLCVPTSAAMVLAYYGDARTARELKTLTRGREYDPAEPFADFTMTWFRDMVSGVRRLGYSWREDTYMNNSWGFRNGVSEIKASLGRSEPVLVDTALYSGHTFVIVGYDDEDSTLDIIDPSIGQPGRRLLKYEEFESIWNSSPVGHNGRGIIFTSRKQ